MSIRLRLLFSYLAMILIPVFFVVISALLIALLYRGDIKELRSIYLPPEHHQKLSPKDQLFNNLQRQSVKDSQELGNQAILKQLDRRLQEYGTGLVVRRGSNIIYQSASTKNMDLEELPEFGFYSEVDPLERSHHQLISLKKLDFFFPDNTEGSLFFVTDASRLARFVHSSYPYLFIGLVLILIITNGLLTYFVSRSIIRPVRELQRAAKQMQEGNLEVPIRARSKDELGQLAQSFEEMRIRLRASIEKQLEYEENRKELIANISHDLKTPITTIKGYVEGIRDGVANSPEKRERYIQTIYAKTINLDKMIDQLFLYSKLDLQRLPFHFEAIPFNDYLRDFVEELRFDLEKMKVEIELNIENNRDYVINGDRENLKRVITNIVDNSLKYNDKEEKKLSFHLSSQDSYLLFSLSDNGLGMSQRNLPFIFGRFYRADQARGTEKGGSGLGLSIAKRIIEEHDGAIWAESKEGEGTTIFFTLRKKAAELDDTDKKGR